MGCLLLEVYFGFLFPEIFTTFQISFLSVYLYGYKFLF